MHDNHDKFKLNCISQDTYFWFWRDVMAILSTGFGKSMTFTFFAVAKEETPSSKTCMISISPLKSTKDDQTS